MSFATQKLSFTDLKNWEADEHVAALNAFRLSASKLVQGAYKERGELVDFGQLTAIAAKSLALKNYSPEEARLFFENSFQPYFISPENCSAASTNSETASFVTGFFEPVVKASRYQSDEFSVPLLARPDDLIDIDDNNRPDGMDPSYRYAMLLDGKVSEHWDRPAIQSGALANRGLELVWLADKTDAFFIHVQGSAKLLLTDGETIRITFAAKSGHPYTSVAKILCSRLVVDPATMTADKLADWMRENPDQIDDLLANNRSYIFFKEVLDLNNDQGPIAAAKVPLIAGRSLAVDRELHSFGLPFWVETFEPLPNQTKPFARLMIAHDTGSAIVGAARGDIFTGSGDEAGLIAGRIRHQASMTILVPKS